MSDEPPKPDDDAWIEKVVKLTTALGMNPTRTRWKLIRWQESRRKAKVRLEQKVLHVRYKHKTCAVCGAVQDRDATVCSSCGEHPGRREFQVLRRIGMSLPVPASVSTLIALACLAVYVRILVASGGGLAVRSEALIELGGRWAPSLAEEPWRLVTSMFLHAGLWHLAFNLVAIATIGPRIEDLYGRGTMLFVFIATGVLANIGSGAVGTFGVGIGASGGVMGLIGLAIGYGQRGGTGASRSLRNDMLKWSGYTIVFGFFVHADNWAHLFGGLAGAAFGYAIRPAHWRMKKLGALRAVAGVAGAIAMVGAVAIIMTRTISPRMDDELSIEETYRTMAVTCRKYWAGEDPGVPSTYHDAPASREELNQMCAGMLSLMRACHSPANVPIYVEDRKQMSKVCTDILAILGDVPNPPTAGSQSPR